MFNKAFICFTAALVVLCNFVVASSHADTRLVSALKTTAMTQNSLIKVGSYGHHHRHHDDWHGYQHKKRYYYHKKKSFIYEQRRKFHESRKDYYKSKYKRSKYKKHDDKWLRKHHLYDHHKKHYRKKYYRKKNYRKKRKVYKIIRPEYEVYTYKPSYSIEKKYLGQRVYGAYKGHPTYYPYYEGVK